MPRSMDGGELFDVLVRRGPYSELDARAALLPLIAALTFIHSNGILHRDLKPENLLLASKSALGDVKVNKQMCRVGSVGCQCFCCGCADRGLWVVDAVEDRGEVHARVRNVGIRSA